MKSAIQQDSTIHLQTLSDGILRCIFSLTCATMPAAGPSASISARAVPGRAVVEGNKLPAKKIAPDTSITRGVASAAPPHPSTCKQQQHAVMQQHNYDAVDATTAKTYDTCLRT